MADKIIFLDIDGVLRIPEKEDNWDSSNKLNKCCCAVLKELLDYSCAFIVLTSSWRLHDRYMEELRKQFCGYGIFSFRIVGQTDDLTSKIGWSTYEELRWLEINDYIKRKCVEKYIIIDDLELSGYDNTHFIKTNITTGLTASLLKSCIEKLR